MLRQNAKKHILIYLFDDAVLVALWYAKLLCLLNSHFERIKTINATWQQRKIEGNCQKGEILL